VVHGFDPLFHDLALAEEGVFFLFGQPIHL
jgi:hypothetical protein